MQEVQVIDARTTISFKAKLQSFLNKHEKYLTVIWQISIFFGYILAFINWIKFMFEIAQAGSVMGFILGLVFMSIIMMIAGILGAVVIFVEILVVTILPYLLIRGLLK